MKKFFIILVLLFFVGCSNITSFSDINSFVKDNDFLTVYNKMNECVVNVNNFPTERDEVELIYYIKSIKENINLFDRSELEMISNLIDFEYNFRYNDDNYSMINLKNDRDFIMNYGN